MKRISQQLLATAIALTMFACAESVTTTPGSSLNVSAAFSSLPLGYGNVVSSFSDGTAGTGSPWLPTGAEMRGGHGGPGDHDLGGGRPGDLGFMCGGLFGLFLGDGFGPGFGHGRHGDPILTGTCTYNATTGNVVCAPETINGVTVNRTARYLTAAGATQAAFDSITTNTIQTTVTAAGTFTRRDSSVSTVQSSSQRTVSGLAKGSTQRSVNGTSAGTETTTGKNTTGSFTAVRVIGDTTKNIIIPVRTDTVPTYPIAGSVIRNLKATLTYVGQAATTSIRREVITYDGSATAKIVITQDGVTQNCTVALPHGRPVCQ
jgi:hypothetical protein